MTSVVILDLLYLHIPKEVFQERTFVAQSAMAGYA